MVMEVREIVLRRGFKVGSYIRGIGTLEWVVLRLFLVLN